MAEKSIFWDTNGTGDGSDDYTMAELVYFVWRKQFGFSANEGPLKGVENELDITVGAGQVTIQTGAALAYGFPYENTANIIISAPAPIGSNRFDIVVLEADWTTQTVRLTSVAGTPGGGVPSLTQNPTVIWQTPIWQLEITPAGAITETDLREFCHFSTELDGASIDDGSVDTDQLADNAVTLAKMADNSVDSAEIVAGAVGTSELDTDAVTTVKILDENVTPAKIQNKSRILQLDFASDGTYFRTLNGQGFVSSSDVDRFFGFTVPDDYVSGGSVEVYGYPLAASGDVEIDWQLVFGADGEAFNTHTASNTKTVAVVSNTIESLISMSSGNLNAGDQVNGRFSRLGTDPNDDCAGTLWVISIYFEYTATS